ICGTARSRFMIAPTAPPSLLMWCRKAADKYQVFQWPMRQSRTGTKPSIHGQSVRAKIGSVLRIGIEMSRIVFWLVLSLFAVAFPLSRASAAVDPTPFSIRDPAFGKDVQMLLDDAEKSMRAGKKEDALRLFNLAASKQPNNPYVISRFAVALNSVGNYEDALTRLSRARKMGAPDNVVLAPMLDAMLSLGQNQVVLDLFPDPPADKSTYTDGIILRGRASALQMMGDSAGASASMKRSLAILNDYNGVMTASRIALMQGNFDAADARAEAALKLMPGDIEARMLRADVALIRGNVAVARKMADSMVAEHPRSVSALMMRIKVYVSTDRPDLVEPEVDRILSDAPNFSMARYFKAVIVARRGDLKAAWDIAHSLPREYIQLDPGIAMNVANIAIGAGYLDSGATILTVAVQRFPYHLEPRLRLADMRLRQKSPEHALNALAVVKDSTDPKVTILFAGIALMKKDQASARKYILRTIDSGGGEELRALDKDTALKSMTNYMTSHPGNTLARKQNALLLLTFGEAPRAKAAYEQLVRDDPADVAALNNLSWLVVNDDPARALSLAQRAVAAAPSSANYLDTLGSMQMSRSDFKGAIVSLTKARLLEPDNASFAYHLALALEASGRGTDSQALLQSLVKRGGFNEYDAAREMLARKLKMVDGAPTGR
ncbi:MAG: tetratricopeptide repeat protein, partial [Rhizomicrobium sp.]